MINAKEASELRNKISPEEKVNSLLWKDLQEALENEIHETVKKCRNHVEAVFKANVCKEPDKDIREALELLGYKGIKVTSDFPWYNETYEWTTTIKFTIP